MTVLCMEEKGEMIINVKEGGIVWDPHKFKCKKQHFDLALAIRFLILKT